MLNLNKESTNLSTDTIIVGKCPVCGSFCMHMYYMEDSKSRKKSKWYSCHCGVVFQDKPPTGKYDISYRQKFQNGGKKLTNAMQFPVKIYSPQIEELLYGRKALVVGTPTHDQVDALRERGWVTFSIDKNESLATTRRHISADFETFDFASDVKYNLIWIYHTLECFLDPVNAIKKSFTLLSEDGILFLATPDTDFIYTRSSSGFIHWKSEYNNIMWNLRSLTYLLDKLGFNVIMSRRNYEQRFAFWDDLHILAQRKFY